VVSGVTTASVTDPELCILLHQDEEIVYRLFATKRGERLRSLAVG